MKLSELNPRYKNGRELVFDCPKLHQGDDNHCVRITKDAGWSFNGDIENLTVSPSILCKTPNICEVHFFIRNGEIIMA